MSINLIGEDKVGIGTDFTQGYSTEFFDWITHDKGRYRRLTNFGKVVNPEGIRTIGEFPNLTAAMEKRGLERDAHQEGDGRELGARIRRSLERLSLRNPDIKTGASTMQPQLPIDVDPNTGVWTTDALPMLYVPRHFFTNNHTAVEEALGRDAYAEILYKAGLQVRVSLVRQGSEAARHRPAWPYSSTT